MSDNPPAGRGSSGNAFRRCFSRPVTPLHQEERGVDSRFSSACLEQFDVLVFVAEDAKAVAAKPAVEEGCVDVAKIGVVLQVARIEVAEAGMLAHRAALDART